MTAAVARFGPLGVFLLMVPESACLPLPSELTLLSAGFGVHQGLFSFPVAVAAATAGNLTGSLIAYWLGRHGVLAKLPGRGGVALTRCEELFGRHGRAPCSWRACCRSPAPSCPCRPDTSACRSCASSS